MRNIPTFAGAVAIGLAMMSPVAAQNIRLHYSADQLLRILVPKPVEPTDSTQPQSRSLVPLVGAELPLPGQEGSGAVPDLQLLFPRNSADLRPETKAQLDELARVLSSDDLKPYQFEIGGHTDVSGDWDYNVRLSQRRADAVTNYLKRNHHITGDRLVAKGYGPAELADPSNPKSQRNRRVEVRTLY